MACILPRSSAARVHDSQAHTKMDVTKSRQGSASYLGAEKNTLVNPNWFQPFQCCCCLCYPGEYLRLATLVSYNSAQVLEACDCLKHLSIHFDLCVDATGVVVFYQLGLFGTDLHAVGCGGFVKTLD